MQPSVHLAFPASRAYGFPGLSLSTNLLRALYVPSSRSLIKILNRTSPGINPWGKPLVTGCWVDVLQLNTALWAWQSCQFSAQLITHLSRPYFTNLALIILWEIVKDLLKVDVYNIHCSPSSKAKKSIRLVRDDLSLINQCLMSKLPSCPSCAWTHLSRAWG